MGLSSFFNGLSNMWLGTDQVYHDVVMPNIINGTGAPFDITKAEQISTLYTCVKTLADTVSRLPINVYSDVDGNRPIDKNNYLYPLLHYNPNNYMTQQTFFATLEYWRNIHGNSFALIHRDGSGKVTSLELLSPSRVVKYNITNNELYYVIKDENGKENTVNSSNILHFKTLTKDGIWGITPLTALRMNLSTTFQGLNTIDNFYKNNAMSPKAIKSTVSGANQRILLEAVEEFKAKNTGSQNAGGMIVLPPNTEMVDMAISLADAELVATLKWNITQIAALYGVPAYMCGILESTKFSSVELMQREFVATTIGVITRAYRQEMEYKLLTTKERLDGVSIEFQTEAIYELDTASRLNNMRTLQNMGVISINDIAKIEGFPLTPYGDNYFIPGNYSTVESVVNRQPAAPKP